MDSTDPSRKKKRNSKEDSAREPRKEGADS